MAPALFMLSLWCADLIRLSPEPGPQSGITLFEFQTDANSDQILGLEVLIGGETACYFSEPPFRKELDLREFPEGPLDVIVVLRFFSGASSRIQFQLTNLKPSLEEDVNYVCIPVYLEWDAGLKPQPAHLNEFRVWEEGREVKPSMLLGDEQPLELVVLLDFSGSMKDRMGMLFRGVRIMLEQLRPRDMVTLIGFNDEVFQLTEKETEHQKIMKVLSMVRPEGNTNLYGAVCAGLNTLEHSKSRRALVLFTDGRHELEGRAAAKSKSLQDCLDRALKSGVPIYAMGTGAAVDREVLRQLARVSGGMEIPPSSMRKLEKAFESLGRSMQNQYLLFYSSPSNSHGSHEIRVTLEGHSGVSLRFPDRIEIR